MVIELNEFGALAEFNINKQKTTMLFKNVISQDYEIDKKLVEKKVKYLGLHWQT